MRLRTGRGWWSRVGSATGSVVVLSFGAIAAGWVRGNNWDIASCDSISCDSPKNKVAQRRAAFSASTDVWIDSNTLDCEQIPNLRPHKGVYNGGTRPKLVEFLQYIFFCGVVELQTSSSPSSMLSHSHSF